MAPRIGDFLALLLVQRVIWILVFVVALSVNLRTVGAHDPVWRTLCRWGALAMYGAWVLTQCLVFLNHTQHFDVGLTHWGAVFSASAILLAFIGRGREALLIVGAIVLVPFLLWIRF